MHPLVAAILLMFMLAFTKTPIAVAGSCDAPDVALDCSMQCASISACLHCCAGAAVSDPTCSARCMRTRVRQPHTRPAHPTHAHVTRLPGTQRPAHRPSNEPPVHLSGSCQLQQDADQVFVTLHVTNDSGNDLTNLQPGHPRVQRDAGTSLVLSSVSSPRSYEMVANGSTVTFQWSGHFISAGALGVNVDASAIAANGARAATGAIDCGTLSPRPTPVPSPVAGPTSEAAQCADCHAAPHMAVVADRWLASAHAASTGAAHGNPECAVCHSPLEAGGNRPISSALWQGVTCSVCHPPEAQRTEWQTPIATYDVATRTYSPVPVYDANVLCTHCHTGDHAPQFHSYGYYMVISGVRCIDCHMAKIPSADPAVGDRAAHDFKVAANLPYSCGTYPGGCHARRPESWAERIIAAGLIHAPRNGN